MRTLRRLGARPAFACAGTDKIALEFGKAAEHR